jgi:hypothetical protein
MNKISLCALGAAGALLLAGAAPAQAASQCRLGNGLKHIVYLQFDNVHLRRDNPNVPSDLEQMPSLLNFLKGKGTLLANHHTPLISHTAVDIVTSLTGVYGEKFGFAVGNSFGFFDPAGTPHFQASFGYWTDLVNEGGTASPILVPLMQDQRGKAHPAPWVPFTRAGCDVGAFSIANIEFENTTSDVDNVFGPTSAQHQENLTNHAKAVADFEGVAIHCAKGSALCGSNAQPDALADEPGGYAGYSALFGNKYVAPAINGGKGYVLDLDGNHVADGASPPNDGFPGFNPTPSQSLGYVAQMLEAGVDVVYFYIADAHDNHNYPGAPANPDGSFGPGEAGYEFQLAAYEKAFGEFFVRLQKDGVTPENTLFVVTSDENDHFAGSAAAATPAGCDGVHVACAYPVGKKGEVDADLSLVYATEFGNTTPFSVHSDDAPTFHIKGNPAQTDPVTRTLERQAGKLVGYDPIIGGDARVAQALADQAELALLHMVTHDPNRTPNFVLFGNPDYFLSASGKTTPPCAPSTDAANCFTQSRNFVWNHGDFQKEIVRTWLGIVGPGVRRLGQTDDLFTDHTDIRPTILSLAQIKDDYAHDGRVIFEILHEDARPRAFREHGGLASRLAEVYKAINAPTGPFGIRTLTGISTQALEADDGNYALLEAKITQLTRRRNDIAGRMIAILETAAFDGARINEFEAEGLIWEARLLLESVP